LWDFVECNIDMRKKVTAAITVDSQFPLWDFFECNQHDSWS